MFKSFLLNRRQFLKVAGITTGAVVAGSGTAFARTLPGRRPALARTEDRTVLVAAPANTIHTACNMCSNFCAASAIRETVAGTTVVRRVEGRAGHPNTRGGLCAKGQAAVQLLYDPDRLKTPLRKRADGSWEVRTWEQAMNDVADGLQAIRGTTAPSTDAAARRAASRVYFLNRRGSYGGMWGAFRAEFGSKNVSASAPICDAAKRLGTWLGVAAARRVRDQRATNYTLLFGRNELEATRYRLGFAHELLQNIKTGGRLVVVDPRRTYTASKAHQYVPVIPGTDLMLILSMCRVILDNSLTADGRVAAVISNTVEPTPGAHWRSDAWANVIRLHANSLARLAAFRDEVFKPQYAPAAAAVVCGVPDATITRLAGEFCGVINPADGLTRARPADWAAVADTTSGIAKYSNGTMASWAMLCLTGLAGGMNIAGGYVAVASSPASTAWSFSSPAIGTQAEESLTRAAGYPFSGTVSTANTEGYRTLIPYAILNGLPRTHPDFRRVPAGPLAAPADGTGVITTDAGGARWADVYGGGSATGGGGIRGLFINHTDPAVADADSDMWARALPRLQFAVAIDVYLNTTHELFPPGSYVLPECTVLERTDATTPTTVSGETVMNLWQLAVSPLHSSRSGYWIFASLGAAMSTRYGVAGGYFATDAAAAAYNTATAGSGRVHRHLPDNEVQFTQSVWGNTAVGGRVWSTVQTNGGIWTTGAHSTIADPEVRFSFVSTESNVNVVEFRQVWENTSTATFTTPLAPQWRAPRNTPTATFPLRFMAGGKVMWHTMAATANLPYLVQDFDENIEVRHTNYLLINPTDAGTRGIASGAWVFVASANGSRIRVQALVTQRISPGYVSLFHGYGERAPQKRTAHNRGVNPNRLTSSRRIDAGTGQFTPNEEIVQVIRA
ncbi:MAG: molybdopterin-dependent oxidoreductase [Firmicutes bacterium]|nr:molybdopterin-dependent oxidoreductase [Bacillota bacterium]